MKKLTKDQIAKEVYRAAQEYQSWCEIKFEDTVFDLEMKTGLSESKAKALLEEAISDVD